MNSDWLKEQRERLGLSQDQLASRLQMEGVNISRAAISAWELGRNSSPLDGAKELVALSKVLNIPLSEVLEVAGIDLLGANRSETARRAATIVDRLPPDAQRAAVDQLRVLERLFSKSTS